MGDEGRGLLSDREKELLGGEADGTGDHAYRAGDLVRTRILTCVPDDVAFLEEHLPELHKKLVTDICGAPPGGEDVLRGGSRAASDTPDGGTEEADPSRTPEEGTEEADRLREQLEDCREELHDLRNELTKADLMLSQGDHVDVEALRETLDELEAAADRDDDAGVERSLQQLRDEIGGG